MGLPAGQARLDALANIRPEIASWERPVDQRTTSSLRGTIGFYIVRGTVPVKIVDTSRHPGGFAQEMNGSSPHRAKTARLRRQRTCDPMPLRTFEGVGGANPLFHNRAAALSHLERMTRSRGGSWITPRAGYHPSNARTAGFCWRLAKKCYRQDPALQAPRGGGVGPLICDQRGRPDVRLLAVWRPINYFRPTGPPRLRKALS